ncbi:hypothetical protein M8542_44150 [Amycolatopsis sp. OK19-0408]|uniref:Uncharacterized protein n=1 Tax=Amycolatopsis iheyensis TaxID=2945988 RepID=A0A9X2NNJ0_9PSEU|nr:hypothetical protein [Amycolatopsis iheyensis]MCR6489827.1 hypothetical protein [Amycolatopsis iheyensis]
MTHRLLRSLGGHLRQRGHHVAFRIAPPVWDESQWRLDRLLRDLATAAAIGARDAEVVRLTGDDPAGRPVALFRWLRDPGTQPGPADELFARGARAAADGDLRELRAVNEELLRLISFGGRPWT